MDTSQPNQHIYTVSGIEQMARYATAVAKTLITHSSTTKATMLALSGDLGAGKTTFTKNLLSALGVTETVTSPTFIIMKRFDLPQESMAKTTFDSVVHIDAYRLESAKELEKLRFAEIISNPRYLIVIEWPEKVAELIPYEDANVHFIYFEVVDHATRTLITEFPLEIADQHA